jgi:SAM-dependent methyltransferase
MSRLGRLKHLINGIRGLTLRKYSSLTFARDVCYNKVAGSHPYTNALHHQWAMNRLLLDFSKKQLQTLPTNSQVLDVGVGSAPYWSLRKDLHWLGIDVTTGPKVNFLINKDSSWPIENNSIDNVFCTQVIEHVENPGFLVSEIQRVLKPGGKVILNAPFLYPFHGMPNDQMRYTTSQLEYLFKEFDVLEIGTLGGIGSSMATIWLNFVNYQISESKMLQFLKVIAFPLWLVGNFITNVLLITLDKFDTTKSFPLNTYLIATSPQ